MLMEWPYFTGKFHHLQPADYTVFFSDGEQDAVMLDTQSTFALPNRLTQIALYPNLNQYLRDVDNEGKSV